MEEAEEVLVVPLREAMADRVLVEGVVQPVVVAAQVGVTGCLPFVSKTSQKYID
jgi:hypothetical protein